MKRPDTKFFLPYQAKWIKDNSRLKLMEKARQIGVSWCLAYRMAAETCKVGARYDFWASSRDDIQARLLLEDVKSFAKILNVGATDLGERVIDDERKLTAHVLEFSNSRRVNSMSSNPNAQAGKRGSRGLDEFALHPDPRLLYAIAYPGITWGGSLEIVSTHRGTGNFFNSLVEEIKHKGNPKGFSLHTVTLQDALDQGFLAKLKAKLPEDDERQAMDDAAYFDFIRSGCPDEETFLQEYMCMPSDDASAFLPYDLLDGCKYPANTVWETDLATAQGAIHMGVDVGRVKDLTVFWVNEDVGGAILTRRVICMQNATFASQEKVFYGLLDLPNMRRACVDQTGIGRQFAERAIERYGSKVEGVTFSGPVKETLAYPVKAALEDRTFKLPDDPFIRADFRSIRKETTSAGNIRFAGDRTVNGHADRFWAAALALHAKSKNVDSFLEPIDLGDSSSSRRDF